MRYVPQRLYQDNELGQCFGNAPLHHPTLAGWTSLALTGGITPTLDNLTRQEQDKTEQNCSCFCRDERTGRAVAKVVRSAVLHMKSDLTWQTYSIGEFEL